MGTVNSDLRMYRDALSQKMRKSQWMQIPVWGDHIGHIGGTDSNGYPRSVPYGEVTGKAKRPTGKVIEVMTSFDYPGGGISLDVPILLPLREKPVYGDNQAEGKEEDRNWVYNRALINQVRKPAKTRDGLAGEQALTPKMIMQIWKNMKDEFVDYNTRWQSYAPYDALYRGYSDNILASKAEGGYGDVISQRSHPNFYVAGYGKVTFNKDNSVYENSINTQLQNLGAGDGLTVQAIRNLSIYSNRHYIVPTSAGQKKIKGMLVINDAQMAQLSQDATFEKHAVALTQYEGDSSPFFSGAYTDYLIEGVLVRVDTNNPGVWINGDSDYDSNRGTLNYGNVNPMANPVHDSDIKLAVFVGASAVMCGHTVPLGFKSRSADYDNVRGEASYTVVGYTRADRLDHDGFLTDSKYIENTSSIVLATYSPNSPSWGTSGS